jgi:hypothetical protein
VCGAAPRRDDHRPGLRHRRVPPRRAQLPDGHAPRPHPRTARAPATRRAAGRRDCAGRDAALRHEPAPSQCRADAAGAGEAPRGAHHRGPAPRACSTRRASRSPT